MRTLYFTSLLLIALSSTAFSQSVTWAIQRQNPAYSKGILCDNDSNVYDYGSQADTSGSFFTKYSPSGSVIFSKWWHGYFFSIENITFDGNQFFYFTGSFKNTVSIGNISITGRGGNDGMVGKMDKNGNMIWIKTFGSHNEEGGKGVCMDPVSGNVVLTGFTTDSLFEGNNYLSHGQQSTLIASYTASGNFVNYKMIDFLPQRDDLFNIGREICHADNGGFYVLTDCEGRYFNGDTISAPLHGRYVVKVNSSLDTLWRKYIVGPACYYGYNGHSLHSTSGNIPYVISYCSSHYGGDGAIIKLDPSNGNVTWEQHQQDGGYGDICVEGNTLFGCVTDSATYCPCPSQFGGWQVVKKIDQNNVFSDSLVFRSQYIYMDKIARNGYGSTFVGGVFNGPYAVIGQDTVYGNTQNGYFLVRIDDSILTGTGTDGLFSNDTHQMNLFPNPTDGKFTIQIENEKETELCIYDMLGNCVMHERTKGQVDISSFNKGVYFIEVSMDGKKEFRRIVLE